MKAFKEALDDRRFRPQPRLPTAFLMALLCLVLIGNIFLFNGKFFRQMFGMYHGNKIGAIFMGILETAMLASWGGTVLHMYRRYIYDIFLIWYGTEEEILVFIDHCNHGWMETGFPSPMPQPWR